MLNIVDPNRACWVVWRSLISHDSKLCISDYSVEREHAGLRRIAGYGVTVTRGAASAMMFTYSTILVTMCRNTITFLRSTFLHRYVPFDGALAFHKIVAWTALAFSCKL